MRTTCAFLLAAAAMLATSCGDGDGGNESERQDTPEALPKPTATRAHIQEICALVEFHQEQTGEWPTSLSQVAPDVFRKDPWGHAYQYKLTEKKPGYVVWSVGPDGKDGTGDDIRSDDP